jgi:nucleoside-diphosphate-sugar epimerase
VTRPPASARSANGLTVHLVTGSNGFLGPFVVDRLLGRGSSEVRCLVLPGTSRARLDEVAAQHPGADLRVVEGHLSSVEECAKLLPGVDVVVHLAAAMKGTPEHIFSSTVVATQNLLEAIRHAPEGQRPRVVHCSSFAVYGVADLPRGSTIDETTPLEPHPDRRDLYAQAKLRQEKLFHEYATQHGLQAAIARPGVIYGPGGPPMSSRVGFFARGVFVELGGKNLLPLSYVENCAEALAVIAERGRFTCDIYNVHDDELLSCDAYLDRFERDVRKVRTVRLPYGATRAIAQVLGALRTASRGRLPAPLSPYAVDTTWKKHRFSNARLHAIGWSPRVSTDEGLRRTFSWLRDQPPERQGAVA